jgi:peroxiredoxin Q/BCP
MEKLKPGDRAPSFELEDQDERIVKLSDFQGRKLLLYFYPRAETPGCTTQACSIKESMHEFSDIGLSAVGISPDTPRAQKKFDTKYCLGFPLLSDPDHAVAEEYGAWGQRTMYGTSTMTIIRSAFVINEEGRIIETFYDVKPEETVPRVLGAIIAASK